MMDKLKSELFTSCMLAIVRKRSPVLTIFLWMVSYQNTLEIVISSTFYSVPTDLDVRLKAVVLGALFVVVSICFINRVVFSIIMVYDLRTLQILPWLHNSKTTELKFQFSIDILCYTHGFIFFFYTYQFISLNFLQLRTYCANYWK